MRTCLVLLLLSTVSPAQSVPPSFDEQHARGVAQNPPGVVLTLSTADGRSTYRLSETIKLRLSFTSRTLHVYTVEAATGWNEAGSSDDLVIAAPGVVEPIHSQARVLAGVACCDSNRFYISQKPRVATFALSLRWVARPILMPDFTTSRDITPGDYSVFVQTRRVMRGWPKSQRDKYTANRGSVMVTSSNILHLAVLPDASEHDGNKP